MEEDSGNSSSRRNYDDSSDDDQNDADTTVPSNNACIECGHGLTTNHATQGRGYFRKQLELVSRDHMIQASRRLPCSRCERDYSSQDNSSRHMKYQHGQCPGASINLVSPEPASSQFDCDSSDIVDDVRNDSNVVNRSGQKADNSKFLVKILPNMGRKRKSDEIKDHRAKKAKTTWIFGKSYAVEKVHASDENERSDYSSDEEASVTSNLNGDEKLDNCEAEISQVSSENLVQDQNHDSDVSYLIINEDYSEDKVTGTSPLKVAHSLSETQHQSNQPTSIVSITISDKESSDDSDEELDNYEEVTQVCSKNMIQYQNHESGESNFIKHEDSEVQDYYYPRIIEAQDSVQDETDNSEDEVTGTSLLKTVDGLSETQYQPDQPTSILYITSSDGKSSVTSESDDNEESDNYEEVSQPSSDNMVQDQNYEAVESNFIDHENSKTVIETQDSQDETDNSEDEVTGTSPPVILYFPIAILDPSDQVLSTLNMIMPELMSSGEEFLIQEEIESYFINDEDSEADIEAQDTVQDETDNSENEPTRTSPSRTVYLVLAILDQSNLVTSILNTSPGKILLTTIKIYYDEESEKYKAEVLLGPSENMVQDENQTSAESNNANHNHSEADVEAQYSVQEETDNSEDEQTRTSPPEIVHKLLKAQDQSNQPTSIPYIISSDDESLITSESDNDEESDGVKAKAEWQNINNTLNDILNQPYQPAPNNNRDNEEVESLPEEVESDNSETYSRDIVNLLSCFISIMIDNILKPN